MNPYIPTTKTVDPAVEKHIKSIVRALRGEIKLMREAGYSEDQIDVKIAFPCDAIAASREADRVVGYCIKSKAALRDYLRPA